MAVLAACAPASKPVKSSNLDSTKEAWYSQTAQQVAAMNRQAENYFQAGKQDKAAELIEQAEPLLKRLLAAAKPTMDVAIAASDLDDLYGRMLFSNHHYGWARLQFQKNVARWKYWTPQTSESVRRLQQAEAAIVECDRHLD